MISFFKRKHQSTQKMDNSSPMSDIELRENELEVLSVTLNLGQLIVEFADTMDQAIEFYLVNKRDDRILLPLISNDSQRYTFTFPWLPDYGMYGILIVCEDESEKFLKFKNGNQIDIASNYQSSWKVSSNNKYFLQSTRPSKSQKRRDIVVLDYEISLGTIIVKIPKNVQLNSPTALIRNQKDDTKSYQIGLKQEGQFLTLELGNFLSSNFFGLGDSYFIFIRDEELNYRLYLPTIQKVGDNYVVNIDYDKEIEMFTYYTSNRRMALKTRRISYALSTLESHITTFDPISERSNVPMLSLIVPCYNVEAYVMETLVSLLRQGLEPENYEVIMVDDASTDETLTILKAFQNRYTNFKLVRNETNKGLGAGRNIGVAHARGEYILFIDSDDYLHPGFLKAIWQEIENTTSDYLSFGVERYHEDKQEFYKAEYAKNIWKKRRDNIKLVDYPYMVWDSTAWNKIINRKFYMTSGLSFPEDNILYEDMATISRMQQLAKSITVLPQYGYVWRVRSSKEKASITQTMDQYVTVLDRLNIVNEILSTLKDPKVIKEVLVKIYMLDFTMLIRRNQKHPTNLLLIKKSLETIINDYDSSKLYKKLPVNIVDLFDNLLAYKELNDELYQYVPQGISGELNNNGKRFKYFYNSLAVRPNVVLYESFFGNNNQGNPRIVLEKLLSLDYDNKIQHYIVIREKDFPTVIWADPIFRRDNVHTVAYNSQRYVQLLATSEYLVLNTSLPHWYIKQEDQKIVQTWHGIPLKKLASQEKQTFFGYKNVQQTMLKTDVLLVQNEWTKNQIVGAYDMGLMSTFKIGYVSWENEKYRLFNAQNLEQASKPKQILYAPTWRYDKETEITLYADVIEKLLAIKGVELYFKAHTNSSQNEQSLLEQFPNLHTVDGDIETKIGQFDLVITDYSSVFFSAIPYQLPIILLQNDKGYAAQQGIHEELNVQFTEMIIESTDELEERVTDLLKQGHIDYATKSWYNKLFEDSETDKLIKEVFGLDTRVQLLEIQENTLAYQVIVLPKVTATNKEAILDVLSSYSAEKSECLLLLEGIYSEKDLALLKIFDGWKKLNRSGSLSLSYDESIFYNEDSMVKSYNRLSSEAKATIDTFCYSEVKRVLPGIKINKIINYSEILAFKKEAEDNLLL